MPLQSDDTGAPYRKRKNDLPGGMFKNSVLEPGEVRELGDMLIQNPTSSWVLCCGGTQSSRQTSHFAFGTASVQTISAVILKVYTEGIMKRKKTVLVAFAVGAVLILLFVNRREPDGEYDQLLRQKLEQKGSQVLAETRKPSGGNAPPPPHDMLTSFVPTDQYFFVGKFPDGPGVEIPFKPGSYPTTPTVSTEPSSGIAQPSPGKRKTRVTLNQGGYIGPESCQECHREIYESFVNTNHAKTTQWASEDTLHGHFEGDQRWMKTKDPNVAMEMLRIDDRFLQRVHFYDWSFDVPMQLIMGSGKLAQTHAYWHRDRLYQHNVTHLSEPDAWINSPGYIDGDAAYARPVPPRCVDCHTTYFSPRDQRNRYDPGSLILGVSCERCHGPAEQHVNYHKEHPGQTEPSHIIQPATLDRQRQIEICGQCHSGRSTFTQRPFSYRPGDTLSDFYQAPPESSTDQNSVHTSNQVVRLSMSKCFTESQMSCITCHDPHGRRETSARAFSETCVSCHQQDDHPCQFDPPAGLRLSEDCISCHMPQRSTANLRLESAAGDVFPTLRDHHIRVDHQAKDEFLRLATPPSKTPAPDVTGPL